MSSLFSLYQHWSPSVSLLSQLGIAPSIINLLFGAIVFGAALAFGLAFGLGGRDAAQRLMESGEASVSDATVRFSAQQPGNQIDTTPRQAVSQDVRQDLP